MSRRPSRRSLSSQEPNEWQSIAALVEWERLCWRWSEQRQADEQQASPLQKSVTVFPIVITPSENVQASLQERVAEVAGAFLERAGMTDIEISKEVFMPPASEDVKKTAAAFGQFVAARPLKTKYALLGQFVGRQRRAPKRSARWLSTRRAR